MGGVGIRREETAGLVGSFTQAAGAQWSEQDMLSAGKARLSGQLGTEQFAALGGALTDVGGKYGDLDKTLSEAVKTGMDNSKNITQMVQATVSLSQRDAASGLALSTGTGALLTSAIGATSVQNMPENMRVQAAATAMGNYEQMTTHRGVNFQSVMEFAKLRRAAPDMSVVEQENLLFKTSGKQLNSALYEAKNVDAMSKEDRAVLAGTLNRMGVGFELPNNASAADIKKVTPRLEALANMRQEKLGLDITAQGLGPESAQIAIDIQKDEAKAIKDHGRRAVMSMKTKLGLGGTDVSNLTGGTSDVAVTAATKTSENVDLATGVQKAQAKLSQDQGNIGQAMGGQDTLKSMIAYANDSNSAIRSTAGAIKSLSDKMTFDPKAFTSGLKSFESAASVFHDNINKLIGAVTRQPTSGGSGTTSLPQQPAGATRKF
jgi:hypothetical protein